MRQRTLLADALEERQLLTVPLVTDHGGSVLQNIQVETVYWNWNTPALKTMATQLNTFVGDVTNSAYWSDLAQYNVNSGSWAGEYDIAGAPPLSKLGLGNIQVTTNADVEAALVANLGKKDANGNVLPKPDPKSTLYLVFLPPGDPFNYTDGTGTFTVAASYSVPRTKPAWTVFGGQHAWNTANNFAYAVIEYPGPVGRGFSNFMSEDAPTVLSFLTVVSSHELVESATDAEAYVNANRTATGFGWYFSPPARAPAIPAAAPRSATRSRARMSGRRWRTSKTPRSPTPGSCSSTGQTSFPSRTTRTTGRWSWRGSRRSSCPATLR